MASDADDSVTHAADKVIKQRAEQFRSVQPAELPSSIGFATMEDLTRIRFELTAIRRLLEKAVGKF